jgi:hypothetical protein
MDDMLIVAKSISEVNKLKILLSREFDMKDLDVAKNILGMEIRRDKTTKRLWLPQCNYVKKVLERFNIYNAKPVSTPLANHFRLSIVLCSKIDDDEKDMSKISYSRVVRCLMYVIVCIRLDLAHSVSVESKFLSNPGRHNWASGSSNA